MSSRPDLPVESRPLELPARDPRRARRGADAPRSARSCTRSATAATPSSRSSRARSRSSTPPARRSSATAASGFLGEMNLLSGQTVFLTAVVTEPLRYIAVDREVLRRLLFEDGSLSDLLLSAFVERRELLQQREGIGIEIVGPPGSERDPPHWSNSPGACAFPTPGSIPRRARRRRPWSRGSSPSEIPLVRLPGGGELRAPSNGELSRALGIGLELEPREEVDLLVLGGGPAGPRRGGLRRLGGPRHAGDREHRARRPGGHLAPDRELPRLPGRASAAPS